MKPRLAGGAGESGSVGRGALHSDGDHVAVRAQEGQGRSVSSGSGGELRVREMAAVVADDRDMEGVCVGVDPAGHFLLCRVVHDR
jgi:hypothetical protein